MVRTTLVDPSLKAALSVKTDATPPSAISVFICGWWVAKLAAVSVMKIRTPLALISPGSAAALAAE